MSSTAKPSKAKALAGVQALIAGTQKHLPNASLTVGNTTYAAASLIQVLQSLVDAITKQNEVKVAAKDALTALHDVKTRVNPVVNAGGLGLGGAASCETDQLTHNRKQEERTRAFAGARCGRGHSVFGPPAS